MFFYINVTTVYLTALFLVMQLFFAFLVNLTMTISHNCDFVSHNCILSVSQCLYILQCDLKLTM